MHEVLVNRLGGLSLPRKSVVRLTYHPDMTLDVYHGRKTTMQQQQDSGPLGANSFPKSRPHFGRATLSRGIIGSHKDCLPLLKWQKNIEAVPSI